MKAIQAISLLVLSLLCLTSIITALEPEEIEARKEARRNRQLERQKRQEDLRANRDQLLKGRGDGEGGLMGGMSDGRPKRDRPMKDSPSTEIGDAPTDIASADRTESASTDSIIDSTVEGALGSNLRQLLQDDIPEPPTDSAFDRILKKLPTKETISGALDEVVNAFSNMDSISSMNAPNLENAASSAAGLLSTLSDTLVGDANMNEALQTFGKNALEGFESAVSSVISFINVNEILPGYTVETIDSGDEGRDVVLRGASDGKVFSIKELDPKSIATSVVDKVNNMLDEVSKMESMDDLVAWMETAENFQDTMKGVGTSLKKVAESIESKVDLSQLENFTLKFR